MAISRSLPLINEEAIADSQAANLIIGFTAIRTSSFFGTLE